MVIVSGIVIFLTIKSAEFVCIFFISQYSDNCSKYRVYIIFLNQVQNYLYCKSHHHQTFKCIEVSNKMLYISLHNKHFMKMISNGLVVSGFVSHNFEKTHMGANLDN